MVSPARRRLQRSQWRQRPRGQQDAVRLRGEDFEEDACDVRHGRWKNINHPQISNG